MLEYSTKLKNKGNLFIPASMRNAVHILDDAYVRLYVQDGEIRITNLQSLLEKSRNIIHKYVPQDISLSEELIQDRRKADD